MKNTRFTVMLILLLSSISCSNIISETMEDKITETVDLTKELAAFELVTAEEKDCAHYYFGNRVRPLTNDLGDALFNGVDFLYGQPLDSSGSYNIFNTGIGGPLSAGKYIRIVHNGINITGLSLIPFAKDLSSGIMYAPPGDRCYIDPIQGEFILPRPSYWSTMDTINSFTEDATIREEQPIYINVTSNLPYSASRTPVTGKFNMAIQVKGYWATLCDALCPFGYNFTLNSGAYSVWVKLHGGEHTLFIGGASNYVKFLDDSIIIQVNGNDYTATGLNLDSVFHHVYVVWNRDQTLSGGKSVRVFLDGVEELSATDTWPEGVFSLQYLVAAQLAWFTVTTDNTKVWKHVVSEDPSWDYNGGDGREDSLHVIYGPDNGYKPILNIENSSGVGFYGMVY